MSNTRPTPGPWRFWPRTGECFASIHAVTGQARQGAFLATVGGGNPEIDEANGRLMAAAPELLEAAEAALVYFEDREDVLDGHDGRPKPNEAMQLATLLRAAIAKAEGWQP